MRRGTYWIKAPTICKVAPAHVADYYSAMAALTDLMQQAAKEMEVSLGKTRAALSHNLTKGEAGEESFRQFLRKHLPDSLGVTKGQIIDSKGRQSRQLDVIVYNKLRTPMLFTSDEGDHQLVPSEGVLAVIEVKIALTKAMVPGLMTNMESVKRLDKTSYYKTNGMIVDSFTMYGKEVETFRTLYFVFSYESSPCKTLQ